MTKIEAMTGIRNRAEKLFTSARVVEVTMKRAEAAWKMAAEKGYTDADDKLDVVLDSISNGDLDRRVAFGGAREWAFIRVAA